MPSRPRTEVGVPKAAAAADRPRAEVSAGCVLGPWECVGTRSLRVSWEVTHGDKKTPGDEPGDIRTPPGLGDCGSARGLFPASPRSLSPHAATISTVTYLAGTECSQGNRDTGRSKTGCPVPAPRRALWDPEPGAAGWACASLSVREAPKPDLASLPSLPGEPRPSLPLGRPDGLGVGSRGLLCGAVGLPAPEGAVGEGKERSCV